MSAARWSLRDFDAGRDDLSPLARELAADPGPGPSTARARPALDRRAALPDGEARGRPQGRRRGEARRGSTPTSSGASPASRRCRRRPLPASPALRRDPAEPGRQEPRGLRPRAAGRGGCGPRPRPPTSSWNSRASCAGTWRAASSRATRSTPASSTGSGPPDHAADAGARAQPPPRPSCARAGVRGLAGRARVCIRLRLLRAVSGRPAGRLAARNITITSGAKEGTAQEFPLVTSQWLLARRSRLCRTGAWCESWTSPPLRSRTSGCSPAGSARVPNARPLGHPRCSTSGRSPALLECKRSPSGLPRTSNSGRSPAHPASNALMSAVKPRDASDRPHP